MRASRDLHFMHVATLCLRLRSGDGDIALTLLAARFECGLVRPVPHGGPRFTPARGAKGRDLQGAVRREYDIIAVWSSDRLSIDWPPTPTRDH